MSDSDSDDLSLDRAANSATRLSDFPLSLPPASINAAIAALQHRFEVLSERIYGNRPPSPDSSGDSSTGTPVPARNYPLFPPIGIVPPVQPRSESSSTDRTDIEQLPMALSTAGPKKPVVTLVPALAPTPYHENKEANGEARTIAYVQVQRAILLHLKTKASDSLSVRSARHWTRSIDRTGNRSPKAKDALRLCYYMRAQGFDVYARFERKDMLLYIVKQTSNVRGKETDTLYWSQNFSTNGIKTFAEIENAQFARRNAISNGTDYRIPTALPDALHLVRQSVAQARAQAQSLRTANRTDELRRAQARLQAELDSEVPDPEVVMAAVQHHESLLV